MYIKIIYDDNDIDIIEKYDSCRIIDSTYILIKDGKNTMRVPLCKVYGIQEIDEKLI